MADSLIVMEEVVNMRLDRWFLRNYPELTKGTVEKLLRSGQIRINKGRARADYRLQENDELRIPPQLLGESKPPAKPLQRKLMLSKVDKLKWQKLLPSLVLFENENIIAINKPSGLAVQGGSKIGVHVDKLLPLLARGDEVPRLVHRLDRHTSGVLLLAKNRRAAESLAADFKEQQIDKLYWALTIGTPKPENGRIAVAIKKQRTKNFEYMQVQNEGDMAETLYSNLQTQNGISWVSCTPLSGRTHQIRVHLAHIGKPILGDQKYGGKKAFPDNIKNIKRIYLHARSIQYQGIHITAPLFDDFTQRMQECGFDLEQDDKENLLTS